MRSLRSRLIAWYVSVGAFIVLIIGIVAAIAMVEAASFQARQAMAAAAADVPAVVARYRAEHPNGGDVDPVLQKRFHSLGVIVHARMMPPKRAPKMRWPGPPPHHKVFATFQRASVWERLLALQIKPVRTSFPGGEAIVFVDPHSLQGLFDRLGVFLLILALVVLTAAWRIAVVVAENTLDPLLRTTGALKRFGSGEFTPVEVRPEDRSELGELARAYNSAVEQVTRALDERSKAEAEMRQFVADAGHQLRTPLTVIMGYVSGMAQRAHTEAEGRRFEAMLAQARRMKDLIDRLITLARLEHGGANAEGRIDLNVLAARVRERFSEAAQERIAVHAADEPAFVAADEADLGEALSALVDNALKYAPHGTVDVRVYRDGGRWAAEVADRGPGMTPEDIRSAFDRFYRGSAAEDTIGTGLGLAIARKSVERAGGSVRIANRDGGGLTVTVLLDAYPARNATLSA